MADAVEITPELERELVQRARAGNEDAFGTLMRSHYEPVFRLVNLLVGQNRIADALPVAENAVKVEPENSQFRSLVEQLKKMKK